MDDIPELGDMNLEEFRREGHRMVDWIAEYLARPEDYPVLSRSRPGDIVARLPGEAPEQGEPMDHIMDDFRDIIVPGITHWNHPGFFAYFGISGSGPGILGDLLASALNVNAMLWRTSPAATELEQVALDWLRRMLGLPAPYRGVIMDTASMATLVAMAAARERLDMDVRRQGLSGRPEVPRLRVYTSEQAHSSVEKAAMTLGIGQTGVCKIPTDDAFRMQTAALEAAIQGDIRAGWQPFCVVATVGTTSTTSIDPVAEIAELSRRHGLWLHVDGAYGGMAAIVPEMRHVLDGCERADSIVVNPHKWLFTPIDCSAFYVRDPQLLERTFSLVPEYLSTGEREVTNYMDWGVQLGRRFRALKLWMVIRHFGREGLAARLREHIRLASTVAEQIDADSDFERLAPTPLSTVCFRVRPRDLAQPGRAADPDRDLRDEIERYLDTLNAAVIDAVNDTGLVFFSHTKVRGRLAIRMAIGNIRSDATQVSNAWALLRGTAHRVDSELRPDFSRAQAVGAIR